MASSVLFINRRNVKRMPVAIKISPQESAYRSNQCLDVSAPSSQLNCTRCHAIIKPRQVTDKNIHPVLGVLLCKKCHHLHDQRRTHSSIQSRNSPYCQWCANDHRVLLDCSTCSAKFCEHCIHKHFRSARTVFKEIQEKKWKCCICFSKPIWHQRAVCAAARNYAENYNNTLKERISKCSAARVHLSFRSSSQNDLHSVTNTTATNSPGNVANGTLPSSPNTITDSEEEKLEHLVARGEVDLGENQTSALQQEKPQCPSCVICLLNSPRMVLYPCGHKCLCEDCSISLTKCDTRCPLCRKMFKDSIKLYE